VVAVFKAAQRSHVFAIPRAVQDAVFGADIPVLSFSISTTRGQRSVQAMGGETSHAAGSQAFFPIWSLLYAIAGYPPQIQRMTEANANHAGKQRNPLGGRSLSDWRGDATPEVKR